MDRNNHQANQNILRFFEDPAIQDRLLSYARACLESAVAGSALPSHPQFPPEINSLRPGLFVTLTHKGALRGCIGHIWGQTELAASIPELCRSSALRDPRFPPVQAKELGGIALELSILNPPYALTDWRSIRVGVDGVVLAVQGRQAVFLPQVATEQGWNLEQTLSALSAKAGLPAQAWRQPSCRFQVFQAIHFGES